MLENCVQNNLLLLVTNTWNKMNYRSLCSIIFRWLKLSEKGLGLFLVFYGSNISQKVSRPWEGLYPIFRLLELCFK